MYKKTLLSIAITSTLALSGCLNDGSDGYEFNNAQSPSVPPTPTAANAAREASKVTVLFNPAKSIMPIPNDILFESTDTDKGTKADGTMFVSHDKTNPVFVGIDAMDGNSVIGAIDIKISDSLSTNIAADAADNFVKNTATGLVIPNPNQSVFLLPLTFPGGDNLLTTKLDTNGDGVKESVEVPSFPEAIRYKTALEATSDLQLLGAGKTSADFTTGIGKASAAAAGLLASGQSTTAGALLVGAGATVADATAALTAGGAALAGGKDATSAILGSFSALVTSSTELTTPIARAEIISLDGDTNNVLRISPLTPLLPKTKYLVIVTNRVKTATGTGVQASQSYSDLKDSNVALLSPSLIPLRSAIQGWEKLAAGYFAAIQGVFDKSTFKSQSMKTPTSSDIALTLTFTTGGTDTVLKDIAAPNLFFEESLKVKYKQAAIKQLVAGNYTLDKLNAKLTDATDIAINTGIANALKSSIADVANGKATKFSDLTSATDQYIAQLTAAKVAISIYDSGDISKGDKDTVNIKTEAAGMVAALTGGGASFPTPKTRKTQFYNTQCLGPLTASGFTICGAGAIDLSMRAPSAHTETTKANKSTVFQAVFAKGAPALLAEGEITLPYFLKVPVDNTVANGKVIKDGTWEADKTIGAVIDGANKSPSGTTPPSSKITYRYPFPTQQTEVTIPVIVTYPNQNVTSALAPATGGIKPANGWPVVIYQHGITTDRSAVLPMADALSFACVNSTQSGPSGAPCYATIAIDQPLHGIAPPSPDATSFASVTGSTVPGLISVSNGSFASTFTNDLAGNTLSGKLTERHFNFTAAANLSATPMDYIKTDGTGGSSGSLFVNLSNFANSRDSLRQAAVDLMNLNASLSTMDIDGDGKVPDLDVSKVYFIGHSLGGVDGIPFLAVNNDAEVQARNSSLPAIKAAGLLNTGGGVPRLLENSPNTGFGAAAILPGLSASSNGILAQGTSSLETYFNILQGVLDSADAMNFAASLKKGKTTGILLTEIVGDGTSTNPSDQTIPNCADSSVDKSQKTTKCEPFATTLDNGFVIKSLTAPLAGGEPLIAQFGATQTAKLSIDGKTKQVAVTRFTAGTHGTPVSNDNASVFAEMITEMVGLFASDGVSVKVTPTASGIIEANN